jgi:hypothetical protein
LHHSLIHDRAGQDGASFIVDLADVLTMPVQHLGAEPDWLAHVTVVAFTLAVGISRIQVMSSNCE